MKKQKNLQACIILKSGPTLISAFSVLKIVLHINNSIHYPLKI